LSDMLVMERLNIEQRSSLLARLPCTDTRF